MNILQTIIQFFKDLFTGNPMIANPFYIKQQPFQLPKTAGSPDWTTPKIENVSQDWSKYISLPYRTQFAKTFDEANCATRAAIECLECLLNYYLMNNLFPDNVATFLKKYYCNAQGFVKLSIRFNSKLNGTTWQGARMDDVWNMLNRDGLVPESVYPDPPAPFTWDSYYSEVPVGLEQYGAMTTKFFQVVWQVMWNQNWNVPDIAKLREALKNSPVYFGGKIGNVDKNGIEQWQGIKSYEHCRVIFAEDGNQEVLDSYTNLDNPSFIRKLSPSFPIATAIKCGINII